MAENKKTCCNESNITGEGTSLLTRLLPLLDPAKVPVDPYNTQDILVFAKHYADLVRFYDINDTIDCVEIESTGTETKGHAGNPDKTKQQHSQKKLIKDKDFVTWKEFFYKDIAVVVASISRWTNRLDSIKDEYNEQRTRTETWPTEQNFRKLFLCIIHHLKRIDRWYERSVDGHTLKKELEVKIRSFLVPSLQKLMSYDKGMILNDTDDLDLVSHYETFKKEIWDLSFNDIVPDDSVYVGNNQKQKILYALMYVDDVFNTMYKVYQEITARSSDYWQQAIEKYPTHQPHLALFISFVELFSYVKSELNDLTRRHLDFFYRDVLHLSEKPASPDSVYLIYNLAKGVDEFDLKEGTELSAGKDALGKTLVYKTDKEIVLNKASVKELKTLFLDIGSIKNIYAAPIANSADGKGEKFKDEENAWSTFGYFEPREDDKEAAAKGSFIGKITGRKAELGFAIASSLLELRSGERKIEIEFTLDTPVDPSKILPSYFKISFTGEKEWIEPIEAKDLEIKFDDADVRKMTIRTFIHAQQDPIVAPGKDFKNFNFKTTFPVVKILLNPDERAYENLKDLKILETKIKTAVSDSTNIILQNDDGKLDASKPAYLLTGFPKVGSSFAVGSAELKDKQLSSITFRGQWIGDLDFANRYIRYDFNNASPELKRTNAANFKCSVELFHDNAWNVQNVSGENDTSHPIALQLFNTEDAAKSNDLNIQLGVEQGTLAGVATKNNNYLFARFVLNPLDFGHEIYPVVTAHQLANRLDVEGNVVPIKTTGGTTPTAAHAPAATPAPATTPVIAPTIVNLQPINLIKIIDTPIKIKIIPPIPTKPPTPKVLPIFVPNPPYTPFASFFFLDYVTESTLLTIDNSNFFHIYPFGETAIYPFKILDGPTMPVIHATPISTIPVIPATPLGTIPTIPATPLGSTIPVISAILLANILEKRRLDKLMLREKKTDQLIVQARELLPQFKYGSDPASIASIKFQNAELYNAYKIRNYYKHNQYRSLTDQQGNLFIGIENLVAPQNLSILFKFADGSAYDNDAEPPTIHWSYLVNNEWLPLPADHVVTDSTYGFQTTGIILFDMPADITNNNTILSNGLYWLCASIDKNADKVPKLIDVIAQANQATFYDQQNDPIHYDSPLPAETISKPVVKIPDIKKIIQPFESFDAKPSEGPVQFYQRVSERLRHKGRAVTPSDYEHLVLQEFPSVYKVKVLSHTDPACLCRYENPESTDPHEEDCCCPQIAPGHVLVVAISNLRNKNAIDPLKPRTGRRTLIKIEEFLKKRVSPFVHVHAKNPKFEEVKVSFNVKFNTGVDKGFFLKQLNDDIVRYLTPWAFDSNVEVLFGNKIYASKIINFIEERKYVDYITCFRMIHVVEGCCTSDTEHDMDCDQMQLDINKSKFLNEVVAKSPQAILVSAKQHCINLIEEDPTQGECNCGDTHK